MISNSRRCAEIAGALGLVWFLFISIQSANANPVLTPGVWKDISPPRSGGEVWYIRIDPSNPSTIYACTGGAGLHKSTDAGSTWKQINICPYIGGMEIDPKNSQHLYVGGWQNGDFWESFDGGTTWTKKPIPVSADIGSFHVDPTDFKHILLSWHYVPDGNGTFLESTDGGASWKAITIPGVQGGGTKGMHFLYQPQLNIGNSKTWLVSTEGGFFRTSDGGAIWTSVASGTNGTHGGLKTTYYTKKGVLFVGGYPCPVKSTDNGITWEKICGNLNGNYWAAIMGDGNKLYIGGDGGSSWIFTSPEEDGKTWATGQAFNPGPGDMAFDTLNRILYIGQRTPGLWALKVDNLTTPVAREISIKKNSALAGIKVIPAGMMKSASMIQGPIFDFRGKLVDRSKMSLQTVVINSRK